MNPCLIRRQYWSSDSTGDGSEPSPFATIQHAIDQAVDGGTVLVADGTYTGDGNRDIDFGGKSIVLMYEKGVDNDGQRLVMGGFPGDSGGICIERKTPLHEFSEYGKTL